LPTLNEKLKRALEEYCYGKQLIYPADSSCTMKYSLISQEYKASEMNEMVQERIYSTDEKLSE
jgi:hypothetical protein